MPESQRGMQWELVPDPNGPETVEEQRQRLGDPLGLGIEKDPEPEPDQN